MDPGFDSETSGWEEGQYNVQTKDKFIPLVLGFGFYLLLQTYTYTVHVCEDTQPHSHIFTQTHIRSHTDSLTLSPLFRTSTSIYPRTCKTKGGSSHHINVQTEGSIVRRQIKHILDWKCDGVSGSMVLYESGTCNTLYRGSCTIETKAHIQTHSQNSWLISDQVQLWCHACIVSVTGPDR